MEKKINIKKEEQRLISGLLNIIKMLVGIVILLIAGSLFFAYQVGSVDKGSQSSTKSGVVQKDISEEESPAPPSDLQIKDGKDVQTGLLAGEGLQLVKGNCTACHSSALILQNRFTREGWHEKIVWMQETQGLWDLGKNEDIILDYLATHYAPEEFVGRRRPLNDIDWYELNN
ncbi:hypothetical protein WJR50_27235 [Catalinimonas sp. 4WD22]|uniref:hypothetical protein n=1 Tax=Catalinimonas locisalis TaxID=3133978 RepID=UPI0031013C7C